MPPRSALWLAVAIAIAVPAATAGGAGWTAPVLISDPGSLDGLTTAISGDSKDQFVAWRRDLNAIEVATRPAGGAFTVAALPSPSGVNPPVIAAGADGRAIVAWQSGGVIYAADRAPGGAFSALGALTGTGGAPVVTVTSGGTEILAWSQSSGVYARAKPPGGVFGPTSTLYASAGGESSFPAAAASDASGNTLIATLTVLPSSPYTSTMRTSRRTDASGFEPAQIVTSASNSGSGNFRTFDGIGITFDAAGYALLTGRDYASTTVSTTTTTTTRVIASWRAPGAASWSPVQELEPPSVQTLSAGFSGKIAFPPVHAVEPSGAATAAWSVNDHPDGSAIHVATAPSAGAAFAPATEPLSSTDNATRYNTPALATQRDGGLLLVDRHATVFESSLRPPGAAAFGPRTPFSPGDQDVTNASLATASDTDGDTLAGWPFYDPSISKSRAWAATYDASPPALGDVTVPATATVGAPAAMSASATDALSTVAGYAWSFGDGSTGDGAAVSHAYAAPGSYTVTVTATDTAGNAVSATRPLTVPASAAVERPVVSSFSISPKRFAVGAGATALTAKTHRGTKLRYAVSAAGTAKVTFARLVGGRRSGKRCVKATSRLRKHKRCTRAVKVKHGLTRHVKAAGPGTIAFSGRLGRKALAPGRYRATIVETVTGAPARSRPRTATFTIVRK